MITFNKLGQYGRFGNQLFHIASTIGVARKHGYPFSFPEWKERKHFKNRLPQTNKQYLDSLREFKLSSNRGLLIEYKDFDCPDNVSLLGHFFSEKYFEHCKEMIRFAFEMKPIKDLPEIKENSICIHVRAGDFGTKQFPRLDMMYYIRGIDQIFKVINERHYWYIFTDDIEYAKKMFLPNSHIYIGSNNYIHDFYLMQKCKHFIIANSTFSWWAAWLARSLKVVAPLRWFGPEAKILSKDIYFIVNIYSKGNKCVLR